MLEKQGALAERWLPM